MKKIGIFLLTLFCLLSFLTAQVSFVSAEETVDSTIAYGCNTLDAGTAMLGKGELVENTKSVILYELTSDTLMYAWNADEQIEPASLVKIMTGLLAVEQGTLSNAITVTAGALADIPEGAATVGLQVDEVLTLEQLLYCMMISSANDAAAVIADHIAGSQQAFVDQMNQYAKDLGCTNTHFANVHGLQDDTQYTTARDLARILSTAMKNDTFCQFFGATEFEVPATNKSEARSLVTGNYLMSQAEVEIYFDERVTGGRTGTTSDGGRSIAVSAESGSQELICILLGAESELAENGYSVSVFGGYPETSELLDMGFDGFKVAQVVHENLALTQRSVDNGDCDVVLGPKTSVYALLKDKVSMDDLTYRYTFYDETIQAPIEKDKGIGIVEVWNGSICVAQTEIYAMNAVPKTELQPVDNVNNGTSNVWNVVLIIIAIIVGLFLLLFLLRIMNRWRRRVATRRNRRNRRRSR